MIQRLFLFTLFLISVSCNPSDEVQLVENRGYAQGTTYQIKYMVKGGRDFGTEIDTLFKKIDASMSTYVESSLITQVNQGNMWVNVDTYFMDVLNRSLAIAEETDGSFDPTVGPIVALWGFGYDEVRTDVTEVMIDEALAKTGNASVEVEGQKVRVPEGFNLDFNAIAQGYTVDVIAEFLEEQGVSRYMVEVGGEVRTRGKNDKGKIWTIGVDKPSEKIDTQDRFQFIIALENTSLATSGNYRKFWVDEETGIRYAHTINPSTGKPAMNKLLSASILAPTTMDADAYATACMVMGLEVCSGFLNENEKLEGYLVYSEDDGSWGEYVTEGFKSSIVN